MIKRKSKKKSKLGPIAIGVVALAAIGGISSDKEEPAVENDPPAIIEEVEQPEKDSVEEIIVDSEVGQTEATKDDQTEHKPVDSEKTSVPSNPDPKPEQESKPVEIDPETAFREKLNQYKYVASKESDKYHYPSCRWTSSINDSNLAHFDSEDEAIASGYSSCGTCKP